MNNLGSSILLFLNELLGLGLQIFLCLYCHAKYFISVVLVRLKLMQNLLVEPRGINFIKLGLQRLAEKALFL